MTFQIRVATIQDAPALWALMDDHKDKFTDDFEAVTKPWLVEIIEGGEVLAICDSTDYPIGGIWLSEILPKTSLKIHFLLDLNYYRQARRLGLFRQWIAFVMRQQQVRTVFAEAMSTQTGTLRWLERLGFQPLIPALKNKSRKNGRLIDGYLFQMTDHRLQRLQRDKNFKPKPILKFPKAHKNCPAQGVARARSLLRLNNDKETIT